MQLKRCVQIRKEAFKTSGSLPEQIEDMYKKWIQVKLQAHSFDCCVPLMDDSSITDTAQLIILICGTDTAFHVHEQNACLCSLMGTKTDKDLVLKAEDLHLWYWAGKN
jgi:hypothetical protein